VHRRSVLLPVRHAAVAAGPRGMPRRGGDLDDEIPF
jgi:hypothetical protein